MSGRRVRGLALLAAVGAIGWWIYATRPTASGIVDTLTRPILGTSAAVGGSERKRVLGEASHAIAADEDKAVAGLRRGMSDTEVRRLLGDPDEIRLAGNERSVRARWIYRSAGRVVVFERRRVVAINVL